MPEAVNSDPDSPFNGATSRLSSQGGNMSAGASWKKRSLWLLEACFNTTTETKTDLDAVFLDNLYIYFLLTTTGIL